MYYAYVSFICIIYMYNLYVSLICIIHMYLQGSLGRSLGAPWGAPGSPWGVQLGSSTDPAPGSQKVLKL